MDDFSSFSGIRDRKAKTSNIRNFKYYMSLSFCGKNEIFTAILEKIYVEKIEIAATEDISRNGSEICFQQLCIRLIKITQMYNISYQ